MSDKPTGNPVFDFKAGFRAKAATLQRVLFYGGVTAEASDGFNDTHLFLLVGLALNLPPLWVAAGVLLISLMAVSRRPYPSVPWMWRQRPASLAAFVAASVVVLVVAPSIGLLFAAGVCAAYPWVRRVPWV